MKVDHVHDKTSMLYETMWDQYNLMFTYTLSVVT